MKSNTSCILGCVSGNKLIIHTIPNYDQHVQITNTHKKLFEMASVGDILDIKTFAPIGILQRITSKNQLFSI